MIILHSSQFSTSVSIKCTIFKQGWKGELEWGAGSSFLHNIWTWGAWLSLIWEDLCLNKFYIYISYSTIKANSPSFNPIHLGSDSNLIQQELQEEGLRPLHSSACDNDFSFRKAFDIVSRLRRWYVEIITSYNHRIIGLKGTGGLLVHPLPKAGDFIASEINGYPISLEDFQRWST